MNPFLLAELESQGYLIYLYVMKKRLALVTNLNYLIDINDLCAKIFQSTSNRLCHIVQHQHDDIMFGVGLFERVDQHFGCLALIECVNKVYICEC